MCVFIQLRCLLYIFMDSMNQIRVFSLQKRYPRGKTFNLRVGVSVESLQTSQINVIITKQTFHWV